MAISADGPMVIRVMFDRARALPAGWWLLAFLVLAGTNAATFLMASDPDSRWDTRFAIAVAARVLLAIWLSYALVRRLAGVLNPVRPGWALLRFALFSLAFMILLALCAFVAGRIAGGADYRLIPVLLNVIISTGLIMLLIRLYAWQGALAVGDRTLGPGRAWRGLAVHHRGFALAYLPIAGLALLHAILTHTAVQAGNDKQELLLIALVDGAVSAAQLVLASTLVVLAWLTARRS